MKPPDFTGLANMSRQLKKKQHILLGIVISFIVLIIAGFAFWGSKTTPNKETDKENFKKHNLASPISATSNEAHWIEKAQNAWKAEQEKSQIFDKSIKALGVDKQQQVKVIQSQKKEISEMKAALTELKQQMVKLQMQKPLPLGTELHQGEVTNGMLPRAGEDRKNNMMEVDSGFIQYTAKLQKRAKSRIKTPDNYVFSNTFAKAVVLQGADVSAGVLSQANPDIMMFQILDDGIMPNGHKSHLKDCFVSGAVIGDISSERGKIRMERLSCIHSDGTSIDTQVTGIVSDSKNGIRGRAVWREEPMVNKAFWGSFWQSMGNIGQQYSSEYSTSPLGSVSTVNPSRIPLAAASAGAAGSAKMYAQYNIKRAEMYHPIIQLPPKVVVDVVFLKGFWLDGGTDTLAPDNPSEIRNPNAHFEGAPDVTPEEKAANQFYKEHSF
ncbi:putative conjugative transfer protein TraB (plasmid) [Legionella fallonii LLAP-10]|uniref:Putative conjugative transfer protein TraB n=2 Tax=Legionella fallonii TaxID=96230 RepID=A0A098G9U4_9GAMM|nr:putative conjugative transfer protein TraB [Legionella fallonii LLAP-10]